jgi:hypothetical protein
MSDFSKIGYLVPMTCLEKMSPSFCGLPSGRMREAEIGRQEKIKRNFASETLTLGYCFLSPN